MSPTESIPGFFNRQLDMDIVVHKAPPPGFPGESQSGTTITLAIKTPQRLHPGPG